MTATQPPKCGVCGIMWHRAYRVAGRYMRFLFFLDCVCGVRVMHHPFLEKAKNKNSRARRIRAIQHDPT
jgi:hypothetical protein